MNIVISTMKSYTDIEQSKKLAKILPHNTADNTWERVVITGCNLDIPEERQYVHRDIPFTFFSGIGVPCWSLAALLDVLPEINGVNLKFERVKAEDGYDGYYYHIEYENKILIPYSKNPVDACYEMILKLYEQKHL